MKKGNLQPTEEVVGSATRRKVVASLAGALLVFGLVDAAAFHLIEERTTNRAYWLLWKKWTLLDAAQQPADWLVLGDSSGNQGVRSDVLSEELGGSVLNLCTFGDMLVLQDAWMLERHIERVGAPRNVVVVHVYDVWRRNPTRALRRAHLAKIPLEWGFWSRFDPPLPLTSTEQRRLLQVRYLPLVRDNRTMLTWALHPSRMFRSDFSVDETGYMRSDVVSRSVLLADVAYHEKDILPYPEAPLSDINRSALQKMAALSDEHGFALYIAASPVYEGLAGLPSFKTYLAGLESALDQAVAGHPRVKILWRDPVTFPAEQMENADHLNHEAAGAYTRSMVQAIRAAR